MKKVLIAGSSDIVGSAVTCHLTGCGYEIVRLVRFPGWQTTAAGEREVKKALRKSLLKYQLHQDVDLFDRAYGYIRQYY